MLIFRAATECWRTSFRCTMRAPSSLSKDGFETLPKTELWFPLASSLHPISVSSLLRCVMRKFQHILYPNEKQTEPNYTHSSPLVIRLSFSLFPSTCALSRLPWVELRNKIAPSTELILWSAPFFSPHVCEKEPGFLSQAPDVTWFHSFGPGLAWLTLLTLCNTQRGNLQWI